jgi:hypothetical protein
VCKYGVADHSLVRLPATTRSWLQRLNSALQCVARAAPPPHILTGWPLHTCSVDSIMLTSVRYFLVFFRIQDPLCNSELRTPQFILHTNKECVYTHYTDGCCIGKAPTAVAEYRRRFAAKRVRRSSQTSKTKVASSPPHLHRTVAAAKISRR